MKNQQKMSLEQRETMIIGVFKFAYFGHVVVGKGIWYLLYFTLTDNNKIISEIVIQEKK